MVEKHGGALSVRKACDLVDARRQGYYEWKQRRDGKRERQDRVLTVKIKNVFYESNRIYGARKIRALLVPMGWRVSRKRIRRLMLSEGLIPVTLRKRVNTTDSKHDMGIFPNLLKQDFRVALPNKAWVSDFTYIPTDEGWLYLCSVIDLFNRGVVSWAVSSTIDRKLAIEAFENAVKNRKPGCGLIFHTDRGCQYASGDFRNAVASIEGIQSMSRSGTPYDNACAETFFKTIKLECLNRKHFETRKAAESAVMMYILFYNRVRIHQSMEYLTPAAFEEVYSA
jgi:transposase InsO family protein